MRMSRLLLFSSLCLRPFTTALEKEEKLSLPPAFYVSSSKYAALKVLDHHSASNLLSTVIERLLLASMRTLTMYSFPWNRPDSFTSNTLIKPRCEHLPTSKSEPLIEMKD